MLLRWTRAGGPYWIDGLLPLAYILDDDVLKAKVQPWIEWALQSQREDGFFGPEKDYPGEPGLQRDNSQDWWPRMVVLKILQQYYSATNDKRVVAFMTKYFRYQLNTLQQIQNWYKDLLHLYKKNKALYELDNDPKGFDWINKDDIFRSIFSFTRHSKDGKKNLLFVCNFTPVDRPDYRVGVPRRKQFKLVLNSDETKYGGSGEERPLLYKPEKQECDGQKYSFAYPLPGYGVAVFEY